MQYYLSRCQELIQVDPEEASKLLERIRSDIQQVQDNDIRRASHELYPSVIRLGLIPALRSLRDRMNSLVPIELVVSSQVSDLDGENGEGFNDEFKIGVYRIVEDALNNVVKHARATGAKVELHSGRDKSFSLRIEDNGFGFEISKISFGLGLMAMRDYSEALGGGGYEVESSPGRGTTIHVILPSIRSFKRLR